MKTGIPAILSSLLCLFLASCLIGPQSKRGTVVDNEAHVGYVFKSDGKPASAARIRVFPVDHVPDSLGKSGQADMGYYTTTDNAGRYSVTSVPAGNYNILADLAGEYSIRDSVRLDEGGADIPGDTLHAPGRLAGMVSLQPQHSPVGAVVQVLGTHIYANVDEKGRFTLDTLAAGGYTLKVTVSYPEYVSLYRSIRITSGKKDSLSDTLRPIFLGIPVVTGLRAVYDTLNATVALTWDSSAYREFSDYLVFRDSSAALELSQVPVAIVSSPSFRDSLARAPNALWPASDTASGAGKALEYRIRIRNKSGDAGPAYGYIKVLAASPGSVRTKIGLKPEAIVWDSITQADSIRIKATLSNPTRKLVTLRWSIGKADSTVLIDSLQSASSSEKVLRFGWAHPGPVTVYARVKDDAGTIWNDSLVLPGNVAPSISGTPLSDLRGYEPFSFVPVVKDADGDSLRFSIANKPAWAQFDTKTGALTGTPANADTSSYAGISIRVSDGRRTSALGDFKLVVIANPWSPRRNAPAASSSTMAATLGDIIYVLQDRFDLEAYDPANDTWSARAPIPKNGVDQVFSLSAYNGKLLALARGGTAVLPRGLLYDPVSDTWTMMPDPTRDSSAVVGFLTSCCMVGGIQYGFDYGGVNAFDPASNRWIRMNAPEFTPRSDNPKCAPLGGKILTTSWEEGLLDRWQLTGGQVRLYDPVTDSWSSADSITPRIRTAVANAGGKIYVAGGLVNPSSPTVSGRMEEFDPADGKWREKTRMPTPAYWMSAAEHKGKLYFFQGGTNTLSGAVTDRVWEYDPTLDH